jgi:hypothetical protein
VERCCAGNAKAATRPSLIWSSNSLAWPPKDGGRARFSDGYIDTGDLSIIESLQNSK